MTSEHFTESELACRCCGVNLCTQQLVGALEAFRASVGAPVIVNSAYRCPAHNAAVGGTPHSQHVLGQAADIRVEGRLAAELAAIAEHVPGVHGIGRADHQGFIHIDVRETPARWCYDAHGRETAWYEPVVTA